MGHSHLRSAQLVAHIGLHSVPAASILKMEPGLRPQGVLALCLLLQLLVAALGGAADQTCSGPAPGQPVAADYSKVLQPGQGDTVDLTDLPGFTRSVYYRDHALITPESRVWAGQPGWTKALTAHLISPASGASFSMFLANITQGGSAAPAPADNIERFVLVLQGVAELTEGSQAAVQLPANYYAYFPPGTAARLKSTEGCGLLVYERPYKAKGKPVLQHGFVDDSALLPTAGEVFDLRKLLPQTTDYDFNIHIMDFKPGEFLNVKEIHYNQHGLLLLEGRGVYRLADKWYPVQAGDAIWMAPYVIQWYAALGYTRSRYVIIKDTTVDPLLQ